MALLLVVCYLLVVNQNGISSTLISSVSLGVAGLAAGALGASYLISLPAAGAELAAELLAGRPSSMMMLSAMISVRYFLVPSWPS